MVLVLVLRRARAPSASLWINRGVVHMVLAGGGQHQFDLLTEVTMVDQPGQKTWRVQLARPTAPPLEVDASMVDPRAFTDALRRWRSQL